MSSDISRQRFDAHKDFSAVLMQQGRVLLDADWNEWIDILRRRMRAETMDTIGRAVVPRLTPLAFKIGVQNGKLTIGPGRMYVDGLLAENHGKRPPTFFDPALEELRSATPLPYEQQPPFLPDAAQVAPLPTTPGPHLVYLDVWEREVTPLEDASLVESALGVDSTTRRQTTWQVRVLADVGNNVTCATPDASLPRWQALIQPSGGRLTTGTVTLPTDPDPCMIPPSGQYRGLENRLYRIEIHTGGGFGQATFKWARHNASVGATVEGFQGRTMTISSVGRDAELRFATGDWVEVIDDVREFKGLPGTLAKVVDVNDAQRSLLLDRDLSAEFPKAERRPRVKRWDQKGRVRDQSGAVVFDLDASGSTGAIPLKKDGDTFLLEDGIQITFNLAAGGAFRVADHWVFTARTADASVEKLQTAPPLGIHHHYARLAVVTLPGAVNDCRLFWPPEFPAGEGECCACTVCVTPEEHNSGAFTIQMAIEQLDPGGGTVCLVPGFYDLTRFPVVAKKPRGVTVRGHGPTTVLASLGKEPALAIELALGFTVEDVLVLSTGVVSKRAEILVTNSALVRLERCYVVQVGSDNAVSPAAPLAIGFLGFSLFATVRDCSILAGNGIGRVGVGTDNRTNVLMLGGFVCEQNNLLCRRRGVVFDGFCLHLGDTRIQENRLQLTDLGGIVTTGMVVRAAQFPATNVEIARNILQTLGDGVRVGTSCTRVEENEIAGLNVKQKGDGIAVEPGLLRVVEDLRVRGNSVAGLNGAGIALEARNVRAYIAENTLTSCTAGGIVTTVENATSEGLQLIANRLRGLTLAANPNTTAIPGQPDLTNRLRAVGPGLAATNTVPWIPAAIDIFGATDVEIAHNRVETLRTAVAKVSSLSGIRVRNARSVRVTENTLVDIVGQQTEGSDCIHLDDIEAAVQVHGNRIEGGTTDPELKKGLRSLGWRALRIGPLLTEKDLPKELKPSAKDRVPSTLLIGVRGNTIHGLGFGPVILIGTEGNVLFGENQILHDSDADGAMILIRAWSLILQANHLLNENNAPALRAAAPRISALGNIYMANMSLVSPLLTPGNWTDFNIQH